MKKKFLSILLALAACLALLSVTAAAEETDTRYLWQADDGKIYWSTAIPSNFPASDGGTALEETTLTLSSSISYPVYRLPKGSYLLLGDITLERTLFAYEDITLDLNGQMLALTESAESGSIIYMQTGNLTLKSCDTESPHKFDTSGDVWTLAASDAMGDNIRIVTGGVLASGKGMRPTASDDVTMGGAVCVLSGDFTMENCNIVGCTTKAGGAVYVRQLSGCSFTFTMTGSRIMGCKASGGMGSSRGGAVWSGAAFTMSNSVIEACKSVSYGGGICVSNTVTLKSGSVIKNCTASNGGGVYVYNVGGLQMDAGAVIENCTATGSEGGGGVYLTTGSGNQHKMAGTITGCSATGNGGGVYYNFDNEKVLTISGTIEKCSAANGGGVYFPASNSTPSRTVILKGGTITGCSATGNGGGVYVDGNKLASCPNTFELDSGSITGCTATNGGGVYLGCDSKTKAAPVFTMGGGSITGCNATGNGGGVYAGNYDGSLNSTVKLSGGEIKGNNAEYGGGIYVETSQLTVRGSVTVTDNFVSGAKDESTGVYVKGEGGTANNIFLPDSYTVSWLQVSGGKVGFSFDSLSEGKMVANGGNTGSFPYCVFDAGDEWALYEEGGGFKAGTKTVLLKHGDDSTGYVKFADAHSAAEDGDTIQFLADMTDVSISKTVTLDLNGQNVSELTVSEPATVIDSEGGGVIDSLTIDVTDMTVGDLLESGCGFKASDGTWYDKSSTETSLSNVEVKKLPITSVSITANGTKPDGKDYYTYTYGDEYDNGCVATTIVKPEAGEELRCEYYVDGRPTGHYCIAYGKTATDTYSLRDMTVNGEPLLSVGTHTIYVVATKDGYTLQSNTVTVEIAKGTLSTSDYTAPTAKADLVFNNNEQALVNSGRSSISDSTFRYGKKNANGEMEWTDTASDVKGCNAGTYTVYWYLDGGTNYQSVGSQENPADTITATIAPKTVTPTVTLGSETLTYDGTAKQPTVTVKVGDDTTLVKDTDYTVSYENNINAGENTAKVTVTAKDGSNYTWVPVTKTFSIAKADISSFAAPEPKNTDYNGEAQRLIATEGSATGGTFHYRLGESGEWTTDISTLTATNAGSYTIYYYVEGDANHLDSGTQASPAGYITASLRKINLSENCTFTLDQTTYTYDGTAKSPTVTVTYKGKPLTENVDYTVTGQTSETDVRVYYLMQVVATESGNFTGQKPMSWYITAAPLTITGVTATDKSYDGTTDAAVSVSFDGLVNGERLTAGTDYTVSGSFSDSNAGTDKTVTAAVTLIRSETAANYTLTGSVPTTRAAINQKVVGLNWTNTSLTYNGNAQKPTATATGLVNGDTCTVTVSGAQTNAGGNYTATATGLSNSNYKLPEANTTTFTIAKADLPEDSHPTGLTGYKGRALSTVELPDDWSWVNGETVLSTEQSTYSANYAGTDNYNAKSDVMLTVNVSEKEQKGLTVTMTGWTYGETAKEPSYATATGAGTPVVRYKSKDAVDEGYRIIVPTNAGDYTVRVTYETDTEIWSGTADFTIAKATPTGAPKYTALSSGKTLADAGLTTEGGTFSIAGTVQWVDANGNALADTTEVAANTAYQWVFTPSDSDNYNAIGGSVTLWHKSSGGGGSSSSGTTITAPVSSDHATVEVKAEVSKGNATVEVGNKQIEKVAADGAGNVTLDVSGLKNVESATVPSHVVEKTNEAENTGLTVALPAGSVTLDETALGSVTENAKGKDVTVSVVSIPTSKLPTAVKNIIGMEPTVIAVVDVNVLVNGVKQSSFDGGKVTVSVPYTPKAGEDTSKLTVWFIKDDGTIENKGGYYDAEKKCFVFETEHLSQYLLVNTNEAVSFTDVPANAWYAASINWASREGITGGIGNGQFGPDLSCTRAQIVTFLWRATGSPEPKTASSFADVPSDAYYAKAVAWAVENGITGGIGNNRFAPDLTCTRAQAAAFLFRYAAANGMEAVTLQELVGGYGDAAQVPGYALPAFNWALARGIVNGNNGNLMPNSDCTRAQIVTMLYRLLGN